MTHSPHLPNSLPPDSAGGMLAESRGMILQRGGEELALEKVSDRFTVCPYSQAALVAVAQEVPAEMAQQIPPAHAAEFIVEPVQRDQVMATVREAEGVAFASHVYQIKDDPGAFVYLTDQITVQFAVPVNSVQQDAIAQAFGLKRLQPVEGLDNTFVFQVTSESTQNPIKITNHLMQLPEVLTAEPNIVMRAQSYYQPADPLYPQQWYLHHSGGANLAAGSHIFAEKAWEITRGDRAVVVAVIDDGFDLNHPDFQGKGKIVAPFDLKDQDGVPSPGGPEENHGTACAGLAIAEENGIGIVGVAPGCSLMPIRTTGFLDDVTIEQVFDWAVQKGAAVISCSWGPSAVYFPLSLRQRAALTRAATLGRNGKGCVVVFAAGNANRPLNGSLHEQGWPRNVLQGPTTWLTGFAIHPDAIAVSACTSLNKKAAYSNWGAEITVCAPSNNAAPTMWLQEAGFVNTPPRLTNALPGAAVLTTDRLDNRGYDAENYTKDFGGTSSACPIVAGVAALVLSVNPTLTATEVKQILQQTADKIIDSDPDPQLGLRKGTYEANGHSQWFGSGKVNAGKAVQAAQQRLASTQLPATRRIEARNETVLPIPDADREGVKSLIAIAEPGLIRDIQISVSVEHSFLGDLEIWLIPPRVSPILLQGRTLGRQTRLQLTYSLETTPLLRQVLTQAAPGNWQLWVIDQARLNTGTLQSWQLSLGF